MLLTKWPNQPARSKPLSTYAFGRLGRHRQRSADWAAIWNIRAWIRQRVPRTPILTPILDMPAVPSTDRLRPRTDAHVLTTDCASWRFDHNHSTSCAIERQTGPLASFRTNSSIVRREFHSLRRSYTLMGCLSPHGQESVRPKRRSISAHIRIIHSIADGFIDQGSANYLTTGLIGDLNLCGSCST